MKVKDTCEVTVVHEEVVEKVQKGLARCQRNGTNLQGAR